GEYALRFKNPDQRLGDVNNEGRKLVRVRMEEEEILGEVVRATSTRRNLASGYKFALTKHFSSDGEYIVTEINHTMHQTPAYISGKKAGQTPYQNSFKCVPTKV